MILPRLLDGRRRVRRFRVEVTPPDLASWKGDLGGPPYVQHFQADQPGPHVMLCALIHGNELCGALALDALLRRGVRPKRGSLTYCFANVDAYHQFQTDAPELSRCVDEDMNRLWDLATLEGPRQSSELRRARQLRPIVESVDYLLDIHSMYLPNQAMTLCGPLTKGRRLAEAIGATPLIVADYGHAAGRRLRDFGGFSDPDSHKAALLVECGQHWLQNAADVALLAALRFLRLFDLIDDATVNAFPLGITPPPASRVVEVTHTVTAATDDFNFYHPYFGMEVIPKAGAVIAYDGDTPIITPYDDCILIMPSRWLTPGQTAVRLGRFLSA